MQRLDPAMITDTENCQYCGQKVTGGYEGCQKMMDELMNQAYSDAVYFTRYRAALDCYCLQHPDIYCKSAKSYAAHLAGLCCEVEHGGSREIHAAIQKWLSGNFSLEKAEIPINYGEITVHSIYKSNSIEAYESRIDSWTASVWAAYCKVHDVAREYLKMALSQ